MKRIFGILLVSFVAFSSNGAEVATRVAFNQEIEYKVRLRSLYKESNTYSFNLKPSDSVATLFELIANKLHCKVQDITLFDNGIYRYCSYFDGEYSPVVIRANPLKYEVSKEITMFKLKPFVCEGNSYLDIWLD